VLENSFLTTGLKDWGFRLVASKDERVEEDKSTRSESLGELTVLLTVLIFEIITSNNEKFLALVVCKISSDIFLVFLLAIDAGYSKWFNFGLPDKERVLA